MNFFDFIKSKTLKRKKNLKKVHPVSTPPKKVSPAESPDTPVKLRSMSLGSKSPENSSKNTRGGKKSKTKKLKKRKTRSKR